MKKIILTIILFMGMIFIPVDVKAASATCSISGKTTVTVGSTVTVTVKVSGSNLYMIKGDVSSNNSAVLSGSGTLYKKADLTSSNGFSSASTSIKFTANSVGTATIVFAADGENCLDVNDNSVSVSGGALTIKVVAKSSNNSNSNNSNSTTVKQGSGENQLSSLTVSEGSLSPQFSPKTTSYTVELDSSVKQVSIAAKAKDSKAKVTGTGTKELSFGDNKFRIVVKAENGDTRTYNIVFKVSEAPSVFTEFNGKKLGFVTNLNDVKAPVGYTKSTTQFDGNEVSCFVNETTGLTLCYLADEQGNKAFYIYADGKVTGTYQTITIDNKVFVIIDISSDQQTKEGMTFTTLTIQEQELSGWKYDDQNLSDYQLLYLMNVQTGEKNFYLYEVTEGTIQKQPSESSETAIQEQTPSNTLTYVFLGTTVLFVLVSIGLFVYLQNFKKKSISAIKAYYERKSRD